MEGLGAQKAYLDQPEQIVEAQRLLLGKPSLDRVLLKYS